jgi:23S rRNA pseudouridine2605 synthase
VSVNGVVLYAPDAPVRLGRDRILVDGQAVSARDRVYLALNKPRGLITTASDEKGRDTVYSCLADPSLPWLSPVGRLDKASEGLLILTNDTAWAARLLDPASHVPRVYHVQAACLADERLLGLIRAGVVEGGERLAVRSVSEVRRGERNSWLEVVLEEGRNRHIRRLLSALGVEVLRLIRTAIGPLRLGDLGKGRWRRLTPAELKALDEALSQGRRQALRC